VIGGPSDEFWALDAHPDAKEAFDKLSYSNRKRHVLAVEGAKTEETRHRRLDKIVTELQSTS
jgi:uncharacterized protein YdeI (YjbR/CyaY-like superfamily)